MRSGCVYTLKRSSRRKPTTVCPNRSAAATARLDGADTAHSTGMPATAAFCTSSNDKPARHEQHLVRERQRAVEQRVADELVERVVAADVFAHRDELTRRR